MIKNAPLAANLNRPESFQLKGGLFPMTLLELRSPSLTEVQAELQDKVNQSPEFFKQSPIVFGFDQLEEHEQNQFDLPALIALCRDLNLMPAATRGGNKNVRDQSVSIGLAHIPKGRVKAIETKVEPPVEKPAQTEAPPAQVETNTLPVTTKIVSHPIRSGQQIYAQGGDLIVLSSVSAGAEVIADGNIHIYGSLRGRALAGVKGDESSRIFCSSQEAELVSIAGHYLVDETLRDTHWRESVQIFLEKDILTIKALS